MEPNWTQNGIKNRSQLQHANFQKSLKNQRKINTFGVPRGRSWDRKSTKHRSEKEVPKGARLGIDFGWIWGSDLEPESFKSELDFWTSELNSYEFHDFVGCLERFASV